MLGGTTVLLLGALLGPAAASVSLRVNCHDTPNRTVYDFHEMDIHGEENISLSKYKGKVMLIFNVATYWGLTTASYLQINALALKYPDLVILGFPCNQFGLQEPGANATEILNGIRHVRPGDNFQPNVTQFFKKIEVNGDYEIPLYTYLKGSCEPTFTRFYTTDKLFYEHLQIGDIAWNFEKFLIGRDGKPKFRYHPHLTDPDHIEMNEDLLTHLEASEPPSVHAEEKTENLDSQVTLDDQLLRAQPGKSGLGRVVVTEAQAP